MKANTVTASPPPKGKYSIWCIDTNAFIPKIHLTLFTNTGKEQEIKISKNNVWVWMNGLTD